MLGWRLSVSKHAAVSSYAGGRDVVVMVVKFVAIWCTSTTTLPLHAMACRWDELGV